MHLQEIAKKCRISITNRYWRDCCMIFDWKENYSVNVKVIDEQHKRLFDIGAKIYDLSQADSRFDYYDELIGILDELKDYTIYHFEFEEKLLEKYNYEALEHQHIEHTFFIKKLEKVGRKDIDAQQSETISEIATWIGDWITHHILVSDMKYKLFLNQKNVY